MRGIPGKKPKEVEYRVKRDAMTPYPAFFAQIAVFGAVHTIKEVEYRVKRDAMTPYPAFFAQIAVFGAVHTILPGSTIRKAEK